MQRWIETANEREIKQVIKAMRLWFKSEENIEKQRILGNYEPFTKIPPMHGLVFTNIAEGPSDKLNEKQREIIKGPPPPYIHVRIHMRLPIKKWSDSDLLKLLLTDEVNPLMHGYMLGRFLKKPLSWKFQTEMLEGALTTSDGSAICTICGIKLDKDEKRIFISNRTLCARCIKAMNFLLNGDS